MNKHFALISYTLEIFTIVAPIWTFSSSAYRKTLYNDKCQTRHNVVPTPTPNREQNKPYCTKQGLCVLCTWINNGHANVMYC